MGGNRTVLYNFSFWTLSLSLPTSMILSTFEQQSLPKRREFVENFLIPTIEEWDRLLIKPQPGTGGIAFAKMSSPSL
jgi:hypothetical protein